MNSPPRAHNALGKLQTIFTSGLLILGLKYYKRGKSAQFRPFGRFDCARESNNRTEKERVFFLFIYPAKQHSQEQSVFLRLFPKGIVNEVCCMCVCVCCFYTEG